MDSDATSRRNGDRRTEAWDGIAYVIPALTWGRESGVTRVADPFHCQTTKKSCLDFFVLVALK